MSDFIELKTFDTLLEENLTLAKQVLGDEWLPLEADIYMKTLRVLTLRQMYNEADKNETIKQLLINTATSSNLDILGYNRGVERLKGSKPYTLFRFAIDEVSTSTLEVPKNTILNDDSNNYFASTIEDMVIVPGTLFIDVKVELDLYVETTIIKTPNIVTTLPFQVTVTQLAEFANGSEFEDDISYRSRIIKSWAIYSTAGSEDSYKYYTLSSDSRIDDVVVLSEEPCVVDIYIASFNNIVDDVMITRVKDSLSPKRVRPISDKVNVYESTKIRVSLHAKIYLFDLLQADYIKQSIEANFNNSFFIGQDLPYSSIIRKMHLEGVYKVEITNQQDYNISNKEIIELENIELDFVGVDNELATI